MFPTPLILSMTNKSKAIFYQFNLTQLSKKKRIESQNKKIKMLKSMLRARLL